MVKLFGTTLEETATALQGRHLSSEDTSNDKTKAVVRIVVSLVLCIVGVYLTLVQDKTTEGVALLTLVAGYWLK